MAFSSMNGAAPPAGVDWDFIAAREGASVKGYVPLDSSGNPLGVSGVTIAVGYDLGQHDLADLRALGIDQSLIALLSPYLGLMGMAAKTFLESNPLAITQAQMLQIDTPAFTKYYNAVAGNYDAATSMNLFQTFPQGAQTAIVSVAYQYGTNLAVKTPKFWKQITTFQWQAAYDNLMNFGDAYPTRRKLEAAQLLTAIDSGNLPAPNMA